MKKTVLLTLALSLMLSVAGCGSKAESQPDTSVDSTVENNNTADVENTTDTDNSADSESTVDTDNSVDNESTADADDSAANDGSDSNAEVSGDSLGQTLLGEFQTIIAADPEADAASIADSVLKNPAIIFTGAVMPVEEGMLMGFGQTEITGFSEGVTFSPMIGTIPFMGYIFRLAEDSDVEAFKDLLKTNADLRWNICTEADELIVESEGNTVFFLMCPESIEE